MIQTLLLTGRHNHDWQRSAPFCRQLLEDTGLFVVDLAEDPDQALADAESLKKYDLFFLDYNGTRWDETAQANFVAAVQDGTGLAVLHAANNSFAGWTEYEKMIGLAWREGTGHGQFHEFTVTIGDHEHPITRGLDDFRTWDELYHRLVPMHGVPYHVLATAHSSRESGGTGEDEPMIVTLQYGHGRVFHQILGHVWPGDPNSGQGNTMIAFESEGFQKTTRRGCQWAATGEVTL